MYLVARTRANANYITSLPYRTCSSLKIGGCKVYTYYKLEKTLGEKTFSLHYANKLTLPPGLSLHSEKNYRLTIELSLLLDTTLFLAIFSILKAFQDTRSRILKRTT